jgi:threonine synthase
VPSGNFGNITAGLFAQKLGLPVNKFIAAVNANDVFTKYIQSGNFTPKPSVRTISNAMDVGNPSNFARIDFLNDSSWNKVKKNIASYTFTDAETELAMREVMQKYNYVLEPHAALAWQKYVSETKTPATGIILGTAHAAKFYDDVVRIINSKINVPESLQNILQKEKLAVALASDFKVFKSFLLDNF